ncbi:chaperone protein dnaJ 20, chloroplastic-like [Magnolia sinica]|uniref:chaperone protein dnaJ 20, chloroplastic-like n=1 Tax=Magnolia sinica TaxID=86752 RepID=UPI0026591CA7|nr:chaperone protein dnaJ 20, chloroplastic-like [Magnolia sinica]
MQYHLPSFTLTPKPLPTPKPLFPKTRLHYKPRFSASVAASARPTTMYELLSVTESAGQDEIKAAFRKMARRWHPDTCRSDNEKEDFTKQFIEAREAYRVLSDPVLREDYDYRLKSGFNGVLLRKRGIRKSGFGDWESQLAGLRTRSYGRATSVSWGRRMRAAAAGNSRA